jgi:uncharacterized alpha-E superfamily protein
VRAWPTSITICWSRVRLTTRIRGPRCSQYYDTPNESDVLDFFTFDVRNPSSILSCINLARDNGRSLRHLISSELWVEINTLYLDAQSWSPEVFESMGVYGFFAELRNRFHRLAGISHATLPRDIEFDFLTVGTMLERAENVSRLLDSKYHYLLPRLEDVGGSIDLMQWAAVLRSASSLEAYRRVYGNQIGVNQVVEFLLLDPGFPRSARFCLDEMDAALARIEKATSGSAPSTPQDSPCHELATILRQSKVEQVMSSGLHEFLMEVQDHCAAIGSMIFDKYLRFE